MKELSLFLNAFVMLTKNKCTNHILAPVFISKLIIMTLLCSEANPRDKLSQSIISFQLFF